MDTSDRLPGELPRVLESQTIFRGRVFEVTVDKVSEGDQTYAREVVHHPGSAVIIPVFDDGTIALVRQYRHPAVRYLLEAPAGTLRRGEVPEDGAARCALVPRLRRGRVTEAEDRRDCLHDFRRAARVERRGPSRVRPSPAPSSALRWPRLPSPRRTPGPSGTSSRSARAPATGRSTRATASAAACSSPRARGARSAARA